MLTIIAEALHRLADAVPPSHGEPVHELAKSIEDALEDAEEKPDALQLAAMTGDPDYLDDPKPDASPSPARSTGRGRRVTGNPDTPPAGPSA